MTAPDLPIWRKSRRSGGEGGNCVELRNKLDAVRDSKNPNGPVLFLDLSGLVATIKAEHLGH